MNFGKIAFQQMPYTDATMMDSNHLGQLLKTQPARLEKVMNQIFSSRDYFSDNPLTSMLNNMGSFGTMELDSNSWEYEMRGASDKPAVCLENVEPISNKKIGIGFSDVQLKLDVDWFKPGEILSPGDSGHVYLLRIQHEPKRHGNGWVYTCKLVTTDFKLFLPLKYVEPGQQWTKMFSAYGEADHQDGGTHIGGSMTFKDYLGKHRKKYEVTDYAFRSVLKCTLPFVDTSGKTVMLDSWFNIVEAEFWKQWYKEIEVAAWYNRKNSSIQNVAGYSVDSYSGIQEKLEDSNRTYYSEFTARKLEEFLMDIWFSRNSPGSSQRKIKIFTGEYGILAFNRAMNNLIETRGSTWACVEGFNPIEKTSSPFHSNSYSVGYQFTKFKGPNGSEVELVHNPIYDSRIFNNEIDPITGVPVESMRFTILDFSGEGSQSNIKLVTRKDSFNFGYVVGLLNPFKKGNLGTIANAIEAYSMHASKMCGVHIEDVSKCGEMIFKRQ